MDRDLWKIIVAATRRLPRRSSRNSVFSNREVIDVLLWAALHNRSVNWACQRSSWPAQAWRRQLPNQSTMSRRLRDPKLHDDMQCVVDHIQRHAPRGRVLLTDGKAMPLSRFSKDPDSRNGWASRSYADGYKLHVVIDSLQNLCGWRVHPMNYAESVATTEIVQSLRPGVGRTLVGDAGYDSNKLYEAADKIGIQLYAKRRKQHRGLSASHKQHGNRLRSIRLIEERRSPVWKKLSFVRTEAERFFSAFVTSGVGMPCLPVWARRLHRVRYWVGAKLIVNAARIRNNKMVHA